MISASAVTLVSRCERRAAFKYGSDVEAAPEVESEAVVMGKGGHLILEYYQRDGTAPPPTPLGDLCRKGLRWLPHPGQATPEGKFEVTISGVPYLGYIDLETSDHRVLPGITEGGLPAVIDYKFSKDPRRYGITAPGDFLQDPQALLYAAYLFIKYGTSRVFLRWLKFKTEGRPEVYPIDATLTRKQVTEAFGRVVHPHATKLVRIREKIRDPNDYPPNYEACHDFGRPCPFMGPCQRSVMPPLLDDMRSLMEPANDTNATPVQAVNPPALATPPKPEAPELALRVILEELGAAFTRAAGRV